MKATFTYATVTPESAELGDYAEHGWTMPGGWEYPLQDDSGHHQDVLDQAQAGAFDFADISGVVSFAQDLGIYYDNGSWLESEPCQNYQTGADTTYSLHINGVTPSTYNRICRLLEIKAA